MSKLKVIMHQVYQKNVRSFGWWSMVLAPLICVLILACLNWYTATSQQTPKVAVVGSTAITKGLVGQNSDSIRYVAYQSESKAKASLNNADSDAMLVVKTGTKSPKLYSREDGQTIPVNTVQSSLGTLNTATVARAMHLNQSQLAALLHVPTVAHQTVAFKGNRMVKTTNQSNATKNLIAVAVGLLMYLFLMSYGSIVASEIATEKGSRVEESILVAIDAKTQFYGKILGIGELILTQLGLYAIGAVGIGLFGDRIPTLKNWMGQIEWQQLGWSFVGILSAFFIIGIISYTVLAALCGSLVSTQEQAGQAVQPVILLSMVGYFASLVVVNGSSTLMSILSYLPFLSPMIMPIRYGVGQVGMVQALMSLGVNAIFLIGFLMLSARAYQANVLVYSQKGLWAALKKSLTLGKHRSSVAIDH
ncbi:ABC transporter permease [Lentilactobacillus hilgardii]|jgi:ABC-2 type transport system permease protein|uniref:ABC transporter permease n=1 Tax=Lentilactobacillus hilgardii TaxID=1588 RepID=UPI0021C37D69|nr:ABC transporter permease [Lentilactobacillus hilgardii]MCP9350240.1 ABC transporter permease [Lentilactobacillus hilgardii]MCP9353116.1 ABC transporter permease [Lentilactobacillus hilgardii]